MNKPKAYRVLTSEELGSFKLHLAWTLFDARDTMWMRWDNREWDDTSIQDPTKWGIHINIPEYCQAFGMIQALRALGYGYIGPRYVDALEDYKADSFWRMVKPTVKEHNLSWLFHTIEKECLEADGFYDKAASWDKTKSNVNRMRELCK